MVRQDELEFLAPTAKPETTSNGKRISDVFSPATLSLGLARSSFVLAINVSVQLSGACERISVAADLEDLITWTILGGRLVCVPQHLA